MENTNDNIFQQHQTNFDIPTRFAINVINITFSQKTPCITLPSSIVTCWILRKKSFHHHLGLIISSLIQRKIVEKISSSSRKSRLIIT